MRRVDRVISTRLDRGSADELAKAAARTERSASDILRQLVREADFSTMAEGQGERRGEGILRRVELTESAPGAIPMPPLGGTTAELMAYVSWLSDIMTAVANEIRRRGGGG